MGFRKMLRRTRIHITDALIHLLYGDGRKTYLYFLRTHTPDEPFTSRQLQLLRKYGQIHHFPNTGNYLVTGFSAADEIFRDQDSFRKIGLPGLDKYDLVRRATPEVHTQVIGFIRDAIHKRYLAEDERFLVQKTRECFDHYARTSTFDFFNGFAKEVIFHVSFRLFGFDEQGTNAFGLRYGYSLKTSAFVPALETWMHDMLGYPAVSADGRMLNVLRSQMSKGTITRDQALDIGKLMMLGALKTSPILLALLLHTLHADQRKWLQALSEDPEVLRKFIEECIRTAPVIRKSVKEVIEDVRIGGCPMYSGSKIYLDITAANRDSVVFDEPEQISLHDNRHRHLSFGVGMHQCPGMQVARHNAMIILRTLLPDLARLHITDSAWYTDVTDDKFIYQPSYLKVKYN